MLYWLSLKEQQWAFNSNKIQKITQIMTVYGPKGTDGGVAPRAYKAEHN